MKTLKRMLTTTETGRQFVREAHHVRTLKTPRALRWMMLALPVVVSVANTSLVQAQEGAGQGTTLNATVAGLGCNTAKGPNQFTVLSFSWGASNPVTVGVGGIGAGKASISSFSVMKPFDGCSPALFGGVVKGTKFATLTIVQLDKKNVALMTVTLTDVFVESIQWSGAAGGGQVTESVAFAFAKSCIQDMPSGNKVCYDAAQVKTF